jgi:hypothetical protein
MNLGQAQIVHVEIEVAQIIVRFGMPRILRERTGEAVKRFRVLWFGGRNSPPTTSPGLLSETRVPLSTDRFAFVAL